MSQAEKLAKHVSIYSVSGILSRLVGFLMLPIYTRYLTPADYGVIALITVVISVLEGTLGVRLVQAVSKFYFEKDDPNYRKVVLSTAILVTTTAGLIATLVMVAARSNISELLFDSSDFSLIVGLFAFSLVTQGIEAYGFLYIRLQQLPLLFLKVSIAKLALQLTLNVYFIIYLEKGLLGVAMAQFLSFSLVACFFSLYIFLKNGFSFSRQFAGRLIRFSWPLWVAGIAMLYTSSVDKFFIQHFDSLAAVGLLGLAQQFSQILTALVWAPFMQYWSAERFQIYHRGDDVAVYNQVFIIVSAIMLAVAAGIAMYSPVAIRVMAEASFHDAYRAVPLLCVGALFQAFTQFSNLGIMVSSQTHWIARADILGAVVVTVLLFYAVPAFGYVGAAGAYAIVSIGRFILIHNISKRTVEMKLSVARLFTVTTILFGLIAVAIGDAGNQSLIAQLLRATQWYIPMLLCIAAYALSSSALRHRLRDMF